MAELREHVNALRVRAVLGRDKWGPPQALGPGSWGLANLDGDGSVVVSVEPGVDGLRIHASMTRHGRTPSYEDLALLHRAAFGDGWAYQVFTPAAEHVNIHDYALHLWGRLDGREWLPDFVEDDTT